MGTLNVRNRAQQLLFEGELKGQLSDGRWENSRPDNHWEPWCNATVVVNVENVGRNFYARRDGYCFTEKALLEIIGDRMLELVQAEIPGYTEKDMLADLRDLRKIIKITRPKTTDELADEAAERDAKNAERAARQRALAERQAERMDRVLRVTGRTDVYPQTGGFLVSPITLDKLLELAEEGVKARQAAFVAAAEEMVQA